MGEPGKKPSWRRRLALSLALAVLAFVAAAAWHIDDWSRDLTENTAATSATAADPLLRPLTLTAPMEAVDAALQAVVKDAPQWELVEYQANGVRQLSLVRTTRWLRFRDDVVVRLTSDNGVVRVDIASKSRVGKGDLGQNPRNIRELNRALKARFPT